MPNCLVPSNATIHAAKSFLSLSDFFNLDGERAVLTLDARWMHMEPFALAAVAAWGRWCRRSGYAIEARNLGPAADYAWRMKLFEHLGVDYHPARREHEEAGRFVPLRNIARPEDVRGVIADLSALLHLDGDPASLTAVQHCASELLRNVLEHAASPDGAYVCAHNYSEGGDKRVTIAVADCGVGIRTHLGQAHPEIADRDDRALLLAMVPGVTGSRPGPYGSPENAGAGLFITRSIAKGTGGYFMLASGTACYRLRRAHTDDAQSVLFPDPELERHDLWELPHAWRGTIVTLEIHTDRIADVGGYFEWIRNHMPARRAGAHGRIRFT